MTIYLLDLETLGLDPSDLIVEVGVLAVSDDLQTEIASFEALVRPPDIAVERVSEIVRQMHTDSGLFDDMLAHSQPLSAVLRGLAGFLDEHADGASAPYMWGGSGVNHFDSGVLARQWPTIRGMLKYRADYDVSPMRAFAQLAGIPEPDVSDLTPHRALPDVRMAWRQAKAYLDILRSAAPLEGS